MVAAVPLKLMVERAIPKETLLGLAVGKYKQYGGVIRWAPGTENAGQIVRHLLPVSQKAFDTPFFTPVSSAVQTVNTYQLHKISGKVDFLTKISQQTLQNSEATMAMSGLNLAVSAVGFAVVYKKLNKLEGKLDSIQKDVKEIKMMLELDERSRLGAVLKDLLALASIDNPDHKNSVLFNAKNTLSPISMKYKELLGKSETIESALAYEEYYCLTSLSHARCLAELGMFSIAQNELEEANAFWKQQAQRIARDLLIGDSPERFLYSDLATLVPTSTLVSWLDFAYEEEKGFDWIDDLRIKNQIWYKAASKEAMKFTSSLFGNVSNYANGVRQNGLGGVTSSFFAKGSSAAVFGSVEEESKRVIPSLYRLTSRNNVLDGYLAQYQLMEDQKMTPLQLETKIKSISKSRPELDFLILSSSAEA